MQLPTYDVCYKLLQQMKKLSLFSTPINQSHGYHPQTNYYFKALVGNRRLKAENFQKQVEIFDSGYIGLATDICLTERRNDIVCMTLDTNKIEILNNGKFPIYKQGLEQKNLRITKTAKELKLLKIGDVPDTNAGIDDLPRNMQGKPSTQLENGIQEILARFQKYYS